MVDGKIGRIGNTDQDTVESLGIEVAVIDAEGCLVTPGLIDPHEHLLGGSGKQGFSTQSPEISLGEIVRPGVTTVVGCLGVDTTMKTLLRAARQGKGVVRGGTHGPDVDRRL